ncbi:MAG: hypothetical protein E6614_02555 [Bradyrhizobium sp.]|nr:hypothetical protein [Bradyrhizobium sp.]
MLEAIRGAATFLREKQVLHKLGVLISIAVIAIACYVLYHMLRGIDTYEVLEAIKSTEPHQIALAALFVAAGYFTLTFYDLFAVRTIGHDHVPYRVNALAAFTSYSIGHNVGASVFTGGAVRYRIYSAHGLNAIDVAKICFLAGLTFWLGNAAVLGLGISYHPEAAASIDQLPPWVNRLAAIAILVGLWQMDREELLAGMLLFRMLYYLAPFLISVILLTFREVIISARSKRLRQAALSLDPSPPPEAAYVRKRSDSGA